MHQVTSRNIALGRTTRSLLDSIIIHLHKSANLTIFRPLGVHLKTNIPISHEVRYLSEKKDSSLSATLFNTEPLNITSIQPVQEKARFNSQAPTESLKWEDTTFKMTYKRTQ